MHFLVKKMNPYRLMRIHYFNCNNGYIVLNKTHLNVMINAAMVLSKKVEEYHFWKEKTYKLK